MTPDAAERRARARVAARGHDIVTTGHVIEWPASGCARMTERETRTHIPGEPDEADRDVLALADALRAAEARAVAAEAERDAAVTGHAALAAAVDAVRVASVPVAEASARYRATWDAVDGTPTIPQSEAIAAALRVSYEARETLDAALTALLRGAPGGYVEARVVREYLRARDAHAMPRPEATTAALRDDVIAARTALDAALLAATTTPKESA